MTPMRHLRPWLLLAAAARAAEPTFDIPGHQIAAGGGTLSTGGVFTVSGTAGQAAAGTAALTPLQLAGGFWAIALQQPDAPRLEAVVAEGQPVFTWRGAGFVLQWASTLGTGASWADVSAPVATNGSTRQVTASAPPAPGAVFYRLRRFAAP